MMDIGEFLYSYGPQNVVKIERVCNLRDDLCKQYLGELKDRQFIKKNAGDEYEIMQRGVDFLRDTIELYRQHFPERRKAIEEDRFWVPKNAGTGPEQGPGVLQRTQQMAIPTTNLDRTVNSTPFVLDKGSNELQNWLETKFQTIDNRLSEVEESLSNNKQTKIRKAWFRTLLGITELGGKTGTEQLADHLAISRSVVSEYLNRMEEEGIVERDFSEHTKDGSRFVWQINWNSLPPEIGSRLRKK